VLELLVLRTGGLDQRLGLGDAAVGARKRLLLLGQRLLGLFDLERPGFYLGQPLLQVGQLPGSLLDCLHGLLSFDGAAIALGLDLGQA
jgi:hypothetical protein